MSKKQQQAAVLMVAALAGQVILGKYARKQAAVIGLPVLAVSVAAVAIGALLG